MAQEDYSMQRKYAFFIDDGELLVVRLAPLFAGVVDE